MTQPRRISCFVIVAAVAFLSPNKATAQSGTVTDDGFLSNNSTTQKLNLNGQGISLIVAGSSAAVGSVSVGTTATYIKFQLQSSLPPNAAAANVSKATLKLFLSPSYSPTGAIDIYPVTSAWTESTLNSSSPPTLAATPFASAVPIGNDLSFVVVDVTALVQEWLNGSSNGGIANDGIALVAHTSATYAVFDSKESIVTSHEPRLEIVLANTGAQGPAGVQGPQGTAGTAGAPGAAATVQVGTTMTVSAGTPASVLNGGTASAAVLNFLIPQGPAGATGPQGPVGINNRGQWSASSSYNVNDAVSDGGSYWLALVPTSATATPPTGCEPSVAACAADWQLVAAQGAMGATGASGGIGPPGPVGPVGPQGPVGPMPTGAALTTASNTFAANQTINGNLTLNGNLILTGAANGIQFSNGTTQTGAGGGGGNSCYLTSSASPVPPSGNAILGSITGGDLWVPVASMPAFRSALAAASTQGKIYAIGGVVVNNTVVSTLSTVEVYDPAANSWSAVASMPTARSSLAAATDATGKIYAIGGVDSSRTIVSTVEMYDPATKIWSTVASMPTARANLAAATDAAGKIYAIGGFDASGNGLSTVEVYDPGSNSWTTANSMPTARYSLAAAASQGKIYAMGGQPNGNSSSILNTVEIYDPATGIWSRGLFMNTPTAQMPAATDATGRIYAIGGLDSTGQLLSTVQVFDPAANLWSTAANLPAVAQNLAAAADSQGRIYAIGRIVGPRSNNVELYSPPVTIYTYIKN